MLRRTLLPALAGVVVVAAALAGAGRPAGAGEVLVNPGFEVWSGGRPSGWNLAPGTSTSQSADAVSGTAVEMHWTGSGGRLSQTVTAVEGATYAASVYFAGQPSVRGAVRVIFLDSSFSMVGEAGQSVTVHGTYQLLTASGQAPAGAVFATLTLEARPFDGETSAFVDSASLDETLPTPTPVPTATPTATLASEATPTPSPSATATASPSTSATSSATTATLTKTPVNTATPTRTATATRTPTRTSQATATKTLTPQPTATPTKTSTPSPPAVLSAFGGLVKNGDFEDVHDGKPLAWSKFGGTLESSKGAFRGNHGAALRSDTTSTKWLFQVAPVVGGQWYSGVTVVAVDGPGDAFIRLSWYSSSDGSGSALEQHDSATTAASAWTPVGTGAVRAPAEARSVRFRLMLRPEGYVTATFDDALLTESPPGTPVPPQSSPVSGPVTGETGTPPALAATPTPTVSDTVAGERIAAAPVLAIEGRGLRLSEVLSDPGEPGRDSAFEWVELVNTGETAVDLTGWKLGDGQTLDTLPVAVVPPGGYVVVAGKSATFIPGLLIVRVRDGEIGSGLNNTGDSLRLVNPDGGEADSMSFGDDDSVFDIAPGAPAAGRTLGRRVADSDPDAGNWALTERPTPGEPNTFPLPGGTPAKPSATRRAAPSAPTGPAPVVAVNRGEGGSPIPWIVLAGSAAAGTVGVALSSQRLRKNRKNDD